MFRALSALFISVAFAASAAAQGQAINGTIEGTVADESGAVLPGVTVSLTNTDTGDMRIVITNESGLYRAPLLRLGTYRISAELAGFKKFEQTGIGLAAGRLGGRLARDLTFVSERPQQLAAARRLRVDR